ncbi:hypothetical protein [Nocardia suismassiliense]|uniref:hypothetical protein n=1 Tax=Nocardia suismassiliense TaxID=2077092 RepID=UPI000D1D9037|nr:hypothetical protein [Nocardia suismassiliense]
MEIHVHPSVVAEISRRVHAQRRAEARAEGLIKGETKGVVVSILELLDVRSIEVPLDARARITSCEDLDVLRLWLRRSVTVTNVADLFEPVGQNCDHGSLADGDC